MLPPMKTLAPHLPGIGSQLPQAELKPPQMLQACQVPAWRSNRSPSSDTDL